MPAGSNCKLDIIRYINPSDDEVGGAYPSGTFLHRSLDARLDEVSADITFLQQGIQAQKVLTGLIWGWELQLREGDDVEVVSPLNHHYYGKRFTIREATYDSRHPGIKQKYVLVKLTRSQIAHSEVHQ